MVQQWIVWLAWLLWYSFTHSANRLNFDLTFEEESCALAKNISAVLSCYSNFLFFFVFLSVTRPKPPLGQIVIGVLKSRNLWCLFAKSCWNINVPKMLRILFSLLCIKYIFFWFYRSVGLKANVEYAEKRYYISHGMRWCCRFHFHYVTNNIVFYLHVYVGRSDGH